MRGSVTTEPEYKVIEHRHLPRRNHSTVTRRAWYLRGRLFRRPALENLDIHVDQTHGSGCDTRNAGGLPEGERPDLGELLDHLARQAGDSLVIEPVGDAARFGALHPLHLFFLLRQVTFVFEVGLDATRFFT